MSNTGPNTKGYKGLLLCSAGPSRKYPVSTAASQQQDLCRHCGKLSLLYACTHNLPCEHIYLPYQHSTCEASPCGLNSSASPNSHEGRMQSLIRAFSPSALHQAGLSADAKKGLYSGSTRMQKIAVQQDNNSSSNLAIQPTQCAARLFMQTICPPNMMVTRTSTAVPRAPHEVSFIGPESCCKHLPALQACADLHAYHSRTLPAMVKTT